MCYHHKDYHPISAKDPYIQKTSSDAEIESPCELTLNVHTSHILVRQSAEKECNAYRKVLPGQYLFWHMA